MRTVANKGLDGPHAEQETEDIRLLLLVELTDVLVRTHIAAWIRIKSKGSVLAVPPLAQGSSECAPPIHPFLPKLEHSCTS